jgi:hypothetical protein
MKTRIILATFLYVSNILGQSNTINSSPTSSSKETTKYIRKYINDLNKIIKKNAIYSDSLNWQILNNHLDSLVKNLKTKEDITIATKYVLDQLRLSGDNHSFFMPKTTVEKFSNHNTDGRQPYAKLIDNHVGYIYVPGFFSISDTACYNFASKIQKLIKDLDSQNSITGWIVDLRQNTGGNMYPMIAGLGPLIGDGTLGYFVHPKTKSTDKWFYSNGSSGEGNEKLVTIQNPYTIKSNNPKIAVLISSQTGSSGEMTAVSFIGKQNVKFFGQPSGGYTTGNQGYKLIDGAYIYLAVSYIEDRNNKKYLGSIYPDVLIDNKNDSLTLTTAERWVQE